MKSHDLVRMFAVYISI